VSKAQQIEADKKRIEANNEAYQSWSNRAASVSVDDLVAAKLIQAEQAGLARQIVAQQLYLMLVTGFLPPK
jgi:hypothetical protein